MKRSKGTSATKSATNWEEVKHTSISIDKVYGESPAMTALGLTNARGSTHGDWSRQSATAQSLKRVIRDSFNYHAGNLTDSQLDALEMIAVKMSRILTGNPTHDDHWQDIQGYALLGMSGHSK